MANVDVIKPRVASADNVAWRWNEGGKSPFVKRVKTIFHPGEVNKIREVYSRSADDYDIVATHSDVPEVYLWNMDKQPNRTEKQGDRGAMSVPDLLLTGHTDNCTFALATSKVAPLIASGGKDNRVCLWSLEDAGSTLAVDGDGKGRKSWNSGGGGGAAGAGGNKLAARVILEGHSEAVEDVAFHPKSADELCSVGDDAALLFWDVRAGKAPVTALGNAHDSDVHCCDWSAHNTDWVITGSADTTVRLFDRRKAGGVAAAGGKGGGKAATAAALVHTFEGHSDAITIVAFSPDAPGVFCSGGRDAVVNVWDANRRGAEQTAAERKAGPPELLFQHAGHRAEVVDLQWNPASSWTLLSSNVPPEEGSGVTGGGALQFWRVLDLIYRPQAEVLAELAAHADVIAGRAPPPVAAVAGAGAGAGGGGDVREVSNGAVGGKKEQEGTAASAGDEAEIAAAAAVAAAAATAQATAMDVS